MYRFHIAFVNFISMDFFISIFLDSLVNQLFLNLPVIVKIINLCIIYIINNWQIIYLSNCFCVLTFKPVILVKITFFWFFFQFLSLNNEEVNFSVSDLKSWKHFSIHLHLGRALSRQKLLWTLFSVNSANNSKKPDRNNWKAYPFMHVVYHTGSYTQYAI